MTAKELMEKDPDFHIGNLDPERDWVKVYPDLLGGACHGYYTTLKLLWEDLNEGKKYPVNETGI
jgi:hypothetical protein